MGRARSGWRGYAGEEERCLQAWHQETAVMRAHVPGAEGCLRMRNDQEASACIALAWGTVGRRARRVQPPAPVPGPIPGHCEEWEP